MKRKSSIQVAFSIILLLFLVITTVIISPQVASTEDTSNTALKSLDTGIEFQEQGDLDKAASSYQKATARVLANRDIKVLLAAKQNLAKIKESQGDIEEAKKLYEDVDAVIDGLELGSILEFNRSPKSDRI
ncbi:hypothetical protein H1P_3660010 [Hyella patelloides LEGE 07179]|uniref:Tetratricopeptide repeat protein n=1 Tax=Hyella patelloides LEGE 07179 TaxID=945734 RepID=A0A563VWG2_9CYAN|nr:hypothetical protein [Hyella patelloides]VEP15751.1 hypothetical protein H1P_3660010 [Hyella patelloides LEGE 07179]